MFLSKLRVSVQRTSSVDIRMLLYHNIMIIKKIELRNKIQNEDLPICLPEVCKMDAVLGSWKIIAGSEKGYEGFFKAMGKKCSLRFRRLRSNTSISASLSLLHLCVSV